MSDLGLKLFKAFGPSVAKITIPEICILWFTTIYNDTLMIK